MKNPKTYLTTSTLLLAFGLAGCTYVSLTEAGALVCLLYTSDAADE